MIHQLMGEASKAANAAVEKWLNDRNAFEVDENGEKFIPRNKMLDVCGFAYIIIMDRRKKTNRDYINKQVQARFSHLNLSPAYKRNQITKISIPYNSYGRQELGLHEAAVRAAYETLISYGIDGIAFRSRMD